MLVTSKELFQKAQQQHFAIPAPNFIDLESLRWHMETAEKLKLPLLLALAEAHIGNNITLEDAALLGKKYAEQAKIPVILHLDHGTTPELIKKAIDFGFTSVMVDASQYPFEENVKRTNEIVEYAHKRGVVVEAEIGYVGANENFEGHEGKDSRYTTVEEAKKFVEQTNVDSLAISIGTAHGIYKGTPKINFERLKEIRTEIDTPLVLHGGSSSGDENLKRCAMEGITKINIFSDLLVAAKTEIDNNKPKTYLEIKEAAKKGMQQCLEHYYNLLS